MAIKSVQTSIAITDPQNNVLAGGSIALDLSQSAILIGGGDVVPTRVTLPLDLTGKIANQPVNLWANDQLSPSGTTYHMRFFNSNNLQVADFGNISIVGAAPVDLSLLTPVVTAPSLSVTNVPFIVAAVNLTGQVAAIGLTTFYTVPASNSSLYRVTVEPLITTAGNAVNLAGTILYSSSGSTTIQNSTTNVPVNLLGASLGTFSALDNFSFMPFGGTNIQYSTTLSGAIGTGVYALRIRLELLG